MAAAWPDFTAQVKQTSACDMVTDHQGPVCDDLASAIERSLYMTRNAGMIDRALRVIVGVALIAIVFVGPQTAWGWVGLVPLLTGLVGNCPLYTILGIKTCKAC
jgi:hypothetical protein